MSKKIISFFFLSLISFALFLFSDQPETEPVRVKFLAETLEWKAGKPKEVALHFQLDPSWHLYWKNPGETGKAPEVEWHLPPGFEVTPLRWPFPKHFVLDEISTFGYEREVTLLATVTPPPSFKEDASLEADVSWIACAESNCLPGAKHLTLEKSSESGFFEKAKQQIPQSLEVSPRKQGDQTIITLPTLLVQKASFFPEEGASMLVPTVQDDAKETTLAFASPIPPGVLCLETGSGVKAYALEMGNEESSSFALILLFALLGGLILNGMPCVLPVISLKLLNLVQIAKESRLRIFQHGAAFSLGVLISFWILAGFLILLQMGGQAFGWGFQLQQPLFVALLAALLFLFALSLFGLYEMGIGVASWAGGKRHSGELLASFLSGILATLVATPCTGPFLGTAVGFASTATPLQSLLIFTALGLGMASPYLLVSLCPSCLRFLPKPGAWMGLFKEIMGFVLIATVLWLLWVFGVETSLNATLTLLVSFFFFALACWIYGKWSTPVKKKRVRLISSLLAAMTLLVAGFTLYHASVLPPQESEEQLVSDAWEPFSAARLEELRAQGVPVFVDFTAKWCLICQTNHVSLSTSDVQKKFGELGVVCMKADWTRNDPQITEELRKFGRNGVPLYLFYGKDPKEPPHILPQILTPDLVLGELEGVQQ